MNPIVKQFKYGQHTVTLETGAIARQATAAVMASMDDTTVFVTVVAKKDVKEGQDFFPLTVNYQERTYAAGKIPGGFFKREGRPSEGETLIARLIDRPIRPLFPEGFFNEIQVVATVVSVNPQISPDLVAMIGASTFQWSYRCSARWFYRQPIRIKPNYGRTKTKPFGLSGCGY